MACGQSAVRARSVDYEIWPLAAGTENHVLFRRSGSWESGRWTERREKAGGGGDLDQALEEGALGTRHLAQPDLCGQWCDPGRRRRERRARRGRRRRPAAQESGLCGGRKICSGKQPRALSEQRRPWASQTRRGAPLDTLLKSLGFRTRLGGMCGARGAGGAALGGRRTGASGTRGRATPRHLQAAGAGCARPVAPRPRGAGPGPGDASAGLGLIVIG